MSDGDKWAVALVHGVGYDKPRELIDGVTPTLKELYPNFEPPPLGDAKRVQFFSTARPTTTLMWETPLGTARARMAEVFWGDLSQVRPGLAALTALWRLFLGLRYVAIVASDLPGSTARFIRALLLAAFVGLRAVLLPLYLVALGLVIGGLLIEWFGDVPSLALSGANLPAWVGLTSLGLAGIALIAYAGLRFARRDRRDARQVAVGTFVFALATAAVAAYDYSTGGGWPQRYFKMLPYNPAEGQTGFGLYVAVNWQWQDYVFGACVIAVAVCALLQLTSRLWWREEAARNSLRIAIVCAATLLVLYFIIFKPLDWAASFYFGKDSKRYMIYWYDWLMLGFVMLVGWAGWRQLQSLDGWRKLYDDNPSGVKAVLPRLIIIPAYQALVVGLCVTVAILAPANELSKFFNSAHTPMLEVTSAERSAAVIFVAFVALLVFAFRSRYQNVFEIVTDVVDHFRQPEQDYPIRRLRQQRLEAAIDALLENNDAANLLILAHSQGSVIVLDSLMNGLWQNRLKDRVQRLVIITMGSPISHVYQHYFAHAYPLDCGPVAGEVCQDQRVVWHHLHRPDDWIGCNVQGPTPNFPCNRPALKLGGHQHYWDWPDALVAVRDLLPGDPVLPARSVV
jgi:hypothetical protein